MRRATTMKDYELMKMSMAELLQPAFERMAEEEPEKLARMLTPEQLVKALTPEQLAKILTPEQITEIFKALPSEVRERIKQGLH